MLARTLLVIDVPAAVSLAATAELCAAQYWVVPLIQRWLGPSAVLPGAQLATALRQASNFVLPVAQARGTALLLDGERFGPPSLRPGATLRRFDNRYRYSAGSFPSMDLLLSEGFSRALWLSDKGVAGDLDLYARLLREAGLSLDEEPVPPAMARRART